MTETTPTTPNTPNTPNTPESSTNREGAATMSEAEARDPGRQHIRFGFYALLTFITLGFLLEFFHGFRIGSYLSEETEPRRLMWTLAHAHGALIGLIHIVVGAVWARLRPSPRLRLASLCLFGAAILLPGGFFLGGLFVYPPDPGLGVVLVPVGGVVLFVGLALVARQT